MDEQTLETLAWRACAQEIISAHVLQGDANVRDGLIEEYAALHGLDLVLVLFDFVSFHYAEQIRPSDAVQASGHFLFTLGDLVEAIAQDLGAHPDTVLLPLVMGDVADEADVDLGFDRDIRRTIHAAQATLVAHFWVRRGRPPVGIQQHLDLDDLCAVTRGLSVLGSALMQAATTRGVPAARLVLMLLPHVEAILGLIANGNEVTVETVISDYWTALTRQAVDIANER